MNQATLYARSAIANLGTTLAALLSLALLLSPAIAGADAVSPPPEDCPAGSEGNASHCGPYCRPISCNDDSDCDDGKSCTEQSLCIYQIEGPCGGWVPQDAGVEYYDAVNGVCSDGAVCNSGQCQVIKVCTAAGTAGSSGGPITVDQGCGCELLGSKGAGSGRWLLLAAAIAVALRFRRETAGRPEPAALLRRHQTTNPCSSPEASSCSMIRRRSANVSAEHLGSRAAAAVSRFSP